MKATQAIEMWHERETVDALQPWEVAEMLDALTMRVEELEAAQQSVQPTVLSHTAQVADCPYCHKQMVIRLHKSHSG